MKPNFAKKFVFDCTYYVQVNGCWKSKVGQFYLKHKGQYTSGRHSIPIIEVMYNISLTRYVNNLSNDDKNKVRFVPIGKIIFHNGRVIIHNESINLSKKNVSFNLPLHKDEVAINNKLRNSIDNSGKKIKKHSKAFIDCGHLSYIMDGVRYEIEKRSSNRCYKPNPVAMLYASGLWLNALKRICENQKHIKSEIDLSSMQFDEKLFFYDYDCIGLDIELYQLLKNRKSPKEILQYIKENNI